MSDQNYLANPASSTELPIAGPDKPLAFYLTDIVNHSEFYPLTMKDIKRTVKRILYFAAANEGASFDVLFPHTTESDDFPTSYQQALTSTTDFYSNNGRAYEQIHSHNGRICAYQIPPGQPVYNCNDCGVDPTCCMCARCFNEREHSDHNVAMHISDGYAICDCGDDASWKHPLDCLANKAQKDKDYPPLSEEVKNAIHEAIQVALEYFLDFESLNTAALPISHGDTVQDIIAWDVTADTHARMPMGKYGEDKEEEPDKLKWWLIVWNDEMHSWDGALEALSSAVDEDHQVMPCIQMTTRIDKDGWCAITSASNPDDLEYPLSEIRNSGLIGTIISNHGANRMCVSNAAIEWINDLTVSWNPRVCEFAKSTLSQLLLVGEYDACYISNTVFDDKDSTEIDGSLAHSEIPITSRGLITLPQPFEFAKFMISNSQMIQITPKITNICGFKPTRLQLLFYLDMRMSKKTRKLLKSFIITSITDTAEARLNFAKQIMAMLPVLEYLNENRDREWTLTLLESFRLQVYHDPAIGTILLNDGLLINALKSCLASVLPLHMTPTSLPIVYSANIFSAFRPQLFVRRLIDVQPQIVRGLGTIVSFLKPGSDKLLEFDHFIYIIAIVSVFQESYKIVRKTGEHAENEDLNYKAYFKFGVIIYRLVKSVGNLVAGIKKPNADVEYAVRFLSNFLDYRYGEKTANNIPLVSSSHVSLLHPLESLLQVICMNYKFYSDNLILPLDSNDSAIASTSGWSHIPASELSKGLEFGPVCNSVQTCVLSSQVLMGFWVRNGTSVETQVRLNAALFDPEANLNMIQTGIRLGIISLNDMFKIWEFGNCISGPGVVVPFDQSIYEDKSSSILLEMVTNFYNLLMFRLPFDSALSSEDNTYLHTRALVCYTLCCEPMRHSVLKEKCDGLPYFDRAFEEVSKYIPPTSVKTYGAYTLKDALYLKLDPMDPLNECTAADDVQEAQLNKIAAMKKKDISDIVIKPQFYHLNSHDLKLTEPIAEFFKSKLFAKFLYKALRFAIDSERNDNHLSATLHLLHAIILDDSIRYGPDKHHLQSFIDIPIANLLLTIVEGSESSKALAKKASTIMELLLLKDDDVMQSLVDCFGQEHIDNYRKSGQGKTMETKMERSRRLARKRQKRILAKMHNQQNQFLKKNKKYFEKMETEEKLKDQHSIDESEEPIEETKEGKGFAELEDDCKTCILCRKPNKEDEVFGIPALISSSSVFWNLPDLHDEGCRCSVDMIPGASKNVHRDHETEAEREEARSFAQYQPAVNSESVITGCPHGMHFSCFLNMIEKKHYSFTSFKCPLCENYCNTFIPSFIMPRFKISAVGEPTVPVEEISSDNGGSNACSLVKILFDSKVSHLLANNDSPEYKKVMDQLRRILHVYQSFWNIDFGFGPMFETLMMNLSSLVGNTIEMYEIASRADEWDMSNKVEHLLLNKVNQNPQIPNIQILLLRSVIQFRLLINYLPEEVLGYNDDDYDQETDEMRCDFALRDPKMGIVQSILTSYLRGNEKIGNLTRYKLACWFLTTIGSLVHRLEKDYTSLKFDGVTFDFHVPIDSPVVKALRKLCSDCDSKDEVKFTDEVLTNIYNILRSLYVRFRNQVKVMMSVLNVSESEDQVIPSFDDMILASTDDDSFEARAGDVSTVPMTDDISRVTLIREFPGPVHLSLIPSKVVDYLDKGFSMHDSSGQKYEEQVICLLCNRVHASKGSHECSMNPHGYGIRFSPSYNILRLSIPAGGGILFATEGGGTAYFRLNPPYLNKYGEAAGGLIGGGESGILDMERYKYLNRRWLDHSLLVSSIRAWKALQDPQTVRFTPFFEMGQMPGFQTDEEEEEEEEEDMNDDDGFMW